MIAQSQSGTGKTAAFTLATLSRINESQNYPQVSVLIIRLFCTYYFLFYVYYTANSFSGFENVVYMNEVYDSINYHIVIFIPHKLDELN